MWHAIGQPWVMSAESQIFLPDLLYNDWESRACHNTSSNSWVDQDNLEWDHRLGFESWSLCMTTTSREAGELDHSHIVPYVDFLIRRITYFQKLTCIKNLNDSRCEFNCLVWQYFEWSNNYCSCQICNSFVIIEVRETANVRAGWNQCGQGSLVILITISQQAFMLSVSLLTILTCWICKGQI